ncbi:MAG TPA: respiratory nitrate reductase subunit gamma [Candidatus Angelobacter sp.]|jgi:nitrate reductase gamma subunit|nr:respiratory nitrate reductase subunit gamma [Candidatus Angelobacter sp.]
MKPNTLFAVWPYVAFALVAGIVLLRYLAVRKRIDVMKFRLTETKEVFHGSGSWRWGLWLLLAGHLVGFLFPKLILRMDTSAAGLMLIEGSFFALAVITLIGWATLMWRHLGRAGGSFFSETADTIFLGLTGVGLLSGLLMAILYRWGSAWGASILFPYVLTVLKGQPTVALASQMPFVVQLHVFSAFAALAVLPFTRLSPFLVLALHRVLALGGRPVAAVFDAMEAWLRKQNLAARFWPEED